MSAPDDWVHDDVIPLGDAECDALVRLKTTQMKDEWLSHLLFGLKEAGRGPSACTRKQPDGVRWDERWFNDGTGEKVRLLVANVRTGLLVGLGTSNGGDEGAETAFRSCVKFANDSTGKRREAIRWEATIRQAPAGRGPIRIGLRLQCPAKLGNTRLQNWGSLHSSQEKLTWFPEVGLRQSTWFFWPIKITGVSRCYGLS